MPQSSIDRSTFYSAAVSVEDSGNQQEETDEETEATEADFFDAEADTEAENKLETQYLSSTLDEKSSPSSSGGNTPSAPNNTPKSDTNNKVKTNLRIHKTGLIRGKTIPKRASRKRINLRRSGQRRMVQKLLCNKTLGMQ